MSKQQSFNFEPKSLSPEEAAFTVSSLNQVIKSKLEGGLSNIWLKGEISNFKAHSSGHFYFSLKDKESQISAVMFRGLNSKLRFRPKDGLEVLVRGKITVYSPRGSYQVLCETMEPLGQGSLKEDFEKLKLKLKSEGLFDSDHKKALPFLPFHIALVTSPTSAAVQDMLQVLKRRHPAAQITVFPCLTQGEKAAPDIIRALDLAERTLGVEVVLLSRGGGSLEDMWCFNDEALARKIFDLKLPVISGVGHEIDFTIADFVADLRAPTPSAAAELVCKNVDEVRERLTQNKRALKYTVLQIIKIHKNEIQHFTKRIVDPRRKLSDIRFRVDDLVLRMERKLGSSFSFEKNRVKSFQQRLELFSKSLSPRKDSLLVLKKRLLRSEESQLFQKKSGLLNLEKMMKALNPFGVLERGYSIVRDEKGKIVRAALELKKEDKLNIQFAKGEVESKILKIIKDKES